jgi:hypothetical protein
VNEVESADGTASAARLFGPGDAVPWPDTSEGRAARAFFEPMLRDGVSAHIRNIQTDLRILRVGGLALPVTVNETPEDNSYVVSPHGHYVSYARDELDIVEGIRGAPVLRAITTSLGAVLRAAAIDRTAHVDNWMISTNLHPAETAEHVPTITHAMVEAFPDHAIAMRSVTPRCDASLAKALEASGYSLVTARWIYLLDARERAPFRTRSYRRDVKLFRENDYELAGPDEITADDAPRMAELYDALYLDKYSRWNPQLTRRFVESALATGAMTFAGVRRAGRLDGILGFVTCNGFLTSPFFGYDTSLPREAGVYRMLNVILMDEARRRGAVLHQSSGVGHFKRSRGGTGGLEWTAVYTAHLPAHRRAAWALLATVANRIGAPLFARYRP